MKVTLKPLLFLLASSTIAFVSCGPNLIFDNGKNSSNSSGNIFTDVINQSHNDYALRLTHKGKKMSYEQFKNKFKQFYEEKKNQNNRDFPNACDQGVLSKCLNENAINHFVILQFINDKTLEFISKTGLPIPWENPSNTYFDWILNWNDEQKTLSGRLEFGHYHSAAKHAAGDQEFSIKFDK